MEATGSVAPITRKWNNMPRSYTTVFGDPDDFEAALSGEGVARFLLTSHGRFRARVTQLLLHHLYLSAAKEELARIAFVSAPADTVLVLLASDRKTVPVCAGVEMRPGEIITLGPGQRVHVRTAGPSRWVAIRIPDQHLVRYGRALIGAGFAVPPYPRWHSPAAAQKHLRQLQRSAVRMVEAHLEIIADAEAAHGLNGPAVISCRRLLEQVGGRLRALILPLPDPILPGRRLYQRTDSEAARPVASAPARAPVRTADEVAMEQQGDQDADQDQAGCI